MCLGPQDAYTKHCKIKNDEIRAVIPSVASDRDLGLEWQAKPLISLRRVARAETSM